jgi:hypothetical protein
MDASISLSFNPYIGFEIELSPEVYGHYVCKIDKKQKDNEDDDDHDDDDDQKESKRKDKIRKRNKRDAIFETSTSPGFSAFPTSEELAADAVEFGQCMANSMTRFIT